MGIYGFLRLGVVPLALIGWTGYQFFIKKKKFQEFKGDLYATLFLVSVYLLLIYWVTN
jgi:hypothetical protein